MLNVVCEGVRQGFGWISPLLFRSFVIYEQVFQMLSGHRDGCRCVVQPPCLCWWKIYREEGKRHSEPNGLGMVRRNSSVWGLHVTCLTTVRKSRGFGVSWEWAGVVDAHAALIGFSQLPIFRLVSCPSLVCVQLCFWNESQDVWVAHSLSLSFFLSLAVKKVLTGLPMF